MFKVDSDKNKNRLYITLEKMTPEDIKPILEELSKNISELDAGFSCLVDIRNMEVPPTSKGSEYIEIVQGALSDTGMGQVVRVIDKENVISHSQMEESSMSLGYRGTPVESIEEAEKILDESK